MTEILDGLNRYWGPLTGTFGGFAVLCFTLGRVWMRAETAIRASGNLHKESIETQKFITAQTEKNATMLNGIGKLEMLLASYTKESIERSTRIETRIDSIFQLINEGNRK